MCVCNGLGLGLARTFPYMVQCQSYVIGSQVSVRTHWQTLRASFVARFQARQRKVRAAPPLQNHREQEQQKSQDCGAGCIGKNGLKAGLSVDTIVEREGRSSQAHAQQGCHQDQDTERCGSNPSTRSLPTLSQVPHKYSGLLARTGPIFKFAMKQSCKLLTPCYLSITSEEPLHKSHTK